MVLQMFAFFCYPFFPVSFSYNMSKGTEVIEEFSVLWVKVVSASKGSRRT
jgi:hypothetical protein